MNFRLKTFGRLELTDEVGAVVPFQEKALLILAYLSTKDLRYASRSELADFLWIDGDTGRGLSNLRQLILRLRTHQHPAAKTILVVNDQGISLAEHGLLADIAQLETVDGDLATQLSKIMQIVTGEFAVNAPLETSRGRLWVEYHREKINARFLGLLTKLESQAAHGHKDLIINAAYRMLELDPHCEEAYRVLMRTFSTTGQLTSARAAFARLKDRLSRDLQVDPDQATLDLLSKISVTETVSFAQPAKPVARGESATAPNISFPRIAILPPVSKAPEYASGLLEDVTIGLCRFKTMSIVAPYSADRIARADEKATAFGKHAISYVLETRLSDRDVSQLYVQLIDVRNDAVLWADRLDMSVFHLPRQYLSLSRKIVALVAGQLETTELNRLGFELHPNAYQYYLMGQRFLKRLDLPEIRRAKKAFRAATRQHPNFSAALAGLSRTAHMEWLLTARGDDTLLEASESLAKDAIVTGTDLAAGYRELGVAKLFQGRFDESIRAFEQAEEASPCHADLIADFADTLIHAADPVKGLEKINLAIELNPLAPDVYHWTAAGANYFLERYTDAIDCLSRMEDQSHISRVAAACWGMLGNQKKASMYKRRTMAMHPDFEIEKWLSIMPAREQWQKDQYREGLRRAGFI